MENVPEDMVNLAREIIRNSYAPYSKYNVASVVRTDNNNVYWGVNIENASYGLTICAERVAIFNAISHGEKKVKEILIAVNNKEPAIPCGACLQVLSEFGDDNTKIYSISLKSNKFKSYKLKDLLPYRFSSKNLNI
jgi:cytidine deaminase